MYQLGRCHTAFFYMHEAQKLIITLFHHADCPGVHIIDNFYVERGQQDICAHEDFWFSLLKRQNSLKCILHLSI